MELSTKANKIINLIDGFLETCDIEKNQKDIYIYQDDLKTVLSNIQRIKKEYESSIFFIVASGAIKSGKSTLINLLANREVSTTKQGRETTLRPAIICKGDEDRILLFNTTKSDLDGILSSKLYDLAIDYIKGFITEGELNKRYSIKITSKPITSENLNTYLTSRIIEGEDDPKLVNIQIKVDDKKQTSLLNHNIAIIDTPGIDGILAGAEGLKEDTKKLNLMDRVDLMLFLQSSITPINKESKEYIINLSKEHSITNMSLIHNKFTLKPWRKKLGLKDDSIDENIDRIAIDEAKQIFKGIIEDLKTNIVDFAKAEDGYRYNNQYLIDESKFEEFEKSLYENIKYNRRRLQDERVENSLLKLIEENIGEQDDIVTVKTIEKRIKDLELQWKAEENQFISKIEKIQEFFYNNQKVLRLVDSPKEQNQTIDDGWELKRTLESVKSDKFPIVSFAFSSKDKESKILKEIKDVVHIENKKLRQKLDSTSTFNNFIAKYDLNGQKMFSLVEEFNALRNDIQIELFELTLDMEKSLLDIEVDIKYIYEKNKTFSDYFPFVKFNEEQIQNVKSDVKGEIRKSAAKRVESFRKILHEEIKSQFEKYNKSLDIKKGQVKTILKSRREKEIEKLNNTKELVQQMKDFFDNLRFEVKNS